MHNFLRGLHKLSSVATLFGFVAIGYWGHHTHWQFVPEHADTSHAADSSELQTASLAESDTPIVASDSGIKVEAVKVDRVREDIPAMAMVVYNGQKYSQVTTRCDGHVLHVFTRIGTPVKKGDVLAIIDSQKVGEAKSDWLQTAVSAHYHKRTLDQLLHSNEAVIPQSRIRAVEAEVRDSELESFMAQQRLLNLGFVIDFELNLERTPKELAEQVRFLGIPKDWLEKLPNMPMTANLVAIQAPFDGVIVEQKAVPGEMVSTDEYQFVVADTSTMWVKLSVKREDATKLNIGQEIEFLADGIAEPFHSRLAWINPEIDSETQTIQAGCEIQNPLAADSLSSMSESTAPTTAASSHRVLQSNQFGTAHICIADRKAALLVPEAAVQRMPDQSLVLFVSDSQASSFERRSVKTGAREDGWLEIVEGVREGEFVVTQGSFILKSELMRSLLAGN